MFLRVGDITFSIKAESPPLALLVIGEALPILNRRRGGESFGAGMVNLSKGRYKDATNIVDVLPEVNISVSVVVIRR